MWPLLLTLVLFCSYISSSYPEYADKENEYEDVNNEYQAAARRRHNSNSISDNKDDESMNGFPQRRRPMRPRRRGCRFNSDCPAERPVCDARRCKDFCIGVCGKNTMCQVTNKNAACACGPGFTGDPFKECKAISLTQLDEEMNRTRLGKSHFRKRLFLIKEEKSWVDAAADCRARDMSLAAIEHDDELTEMTRIINSMGVANNDIWLGGTDLGEKGRLLWIASGHLVKYPDLAKWAAGNGVSNKDQHCLTIKNATSKKWGFSNCDSKVYFFCQYYVE